MMPTKFNIERMAIRRELANAQRAVLYHLDRRLGAPANELETLRRQENLIAARLRENRAKQQLAKFDAEHK